MNVLLLYRPKNSPFTYPTLAQDLAKHDIHITEYSTNVLGLLLPNVIARQLRRGSFDVMACATDAIFEAAKLGTQLADSEDIAIVKWPENQSTAHIKIVRNDNAQNTCLLTDINDSRQAITAFAKTAPADMRLRVLGTEKARKIMPVIHLCRKHHLEDRIDWLGDNYDLEDELSNCQSFYAGTRPLNCLEASLSAAGVPCVDPADFTKSAVRDDWQSAEFHVKQLVELLQNARCS